jgi:O-antigen/teichoic acid export membrane protein
VTESQGGAMKTGILAYLDRNRLRQQVIPWAMKGGLAILDQGLITGSNFVIGILLARWMAPEQYGAYAVAFAVFLLVAMLYQALLIEPMAVFGAAAYRDCIRGYLKALMWVHMATALPMFLALLIAAQVAFRRGEPGGLPGALLAIALSGPCVLLFWLVRRAFYLRLSPAPAVWGATLYCALTMGGLFVAFRLHLLSPFSALLLMGLGAIGATTFLLSYLRMHLPKGEAAPTVRETWQKHWHYGRWALGSAAMMWIPANIFYPLVSSFNGMAHAGELKALMNFAAPMLQLYSALSGLLLPYAARVHADYSHAGAQKVVRRLTLLCVSGAVVYWAILLVFQKPIFQILYSGRYSEVEYLMPVVGLASISGSAFFGPATVLRAMESPSSVFGAVFVSSLVSVLVGVPATKMLGVQGAVWGMAIAETLAFVIAMALLRRKLRLAPVATQPLPVAAND